MIQAHNAIARLRRDLVLGSLVNAAFVASVFVCVLIGASMENAFVDLVLLLALAATWTALGFRSMRGSRLGLIGCPAGAAAGASAKLTAVYLALSNGKTVIVPAPSMRRISGMASSAIVLANRAPNSPRVSVALMELKFNPRPALAKSVSL